MNQMTILRGFALAMLFIPALALGQFTMITEPAGQSDDDYSTNGHIAIESANGDVLVFVAKNGEPTGPCCPPPGEPANLLMYRTRDGGNSWSGPVVLDTAIDDGLQAIIIPTAVTMDNGNILLSYGYINDFAPNFSVSNRVWMSTDNGNSWMRKNDKDNIDYNLVASSTGTVFSLDAEQTDDGGEQLAAYRYEADIDSWTRLGTVPYGESNACGRALHATTDNLLTFYSSSCVFGPGGTLEAFRSVSNDGGATWGPQEQVFTSDSGFGDWGSVVSMPFGGLRAIFQNGGVFAYRDSPDGGATWSEASNWTAGTQDNGDISSVCTPSRFGALCAFLGRRGSVNQLVQVGVAGVSRDSLLGPAPIGASHSGSWWNDTQNGHGFSMEVGVTQGGDPLAVVFWYIFDNEGNPIFFVGTGTPSDNTVDLAFVSPIGMEFGVFNSLTGDQTPAAGTGRFVFSDDRNGVFSYDPSSFSISEWGHSAITDLPVTKLFAIPTNTPLTSDQ